MPVRVSKHTPQVKAAKYRKWKGNFVKITGGAFDEAWDPSVDRNGSFAQDQLKHFTKLASEDPSKLEAYYNEKRADVLKAHNEGKNLVEYGRDENGKLVHFLENRDGQLNFAAQEFNKGGQRRIEEAKTNIINQARERVILGLATKADLVELYRYDHAKEKDNSVGAQLERAFDDLFDNDFFDGFRYGFGSVLQLGAPLFDYVPGGEGASEYIDEAGKFIQGDIDSVDTIINRQNLRAEKSDPGYYQNDIVKRAVPFDPAAAQADDLIKKQQTEEAFRAEQYSGDKRQEYNDAAVASYKQSQGLTDEQYDKIALPEAEFKKKYAEPVAQHMAPESVDTTPTPMLPEGEEFKQAPLEEVNDSVDDNIASQGSQPSATSGDLGAINTKLDKLQSSVDGIIGRAKARKAKHKLTGGGAGPDDRPGAREGVHVPNWNRQMEVAVTRHRRYFAQIQAEIAEAREQGRPAQYIANLQRDSDEIEGELRRLVHNLNQANNGHGHVPGGPDVGGAISERPLDTDDVHIEAEQHLEKLREQYDQLLVELTRARGNEKRQTEIGSQMTQVNNRIEIAERLVQDRVDRSSWMQYGRHNPNMPVNPLNRYMREHPNSRSSGGALGNKKRKPDRDIRRDKPISPADKAELARLEEELAAAEFDFDDADEADRISGQIDAIIAKYGGMHRDPRDYEMGGTVKRKRDYTPHAPASPYDPATVRRLWEIEQRLHALMNQGNIFGGPHSAEIRRLFEEQRDLTNVLDMQDQRNNDPHANQRNGFFRNMNQRGGWRR